MYRARLVLPRCAAARAARALRLPDGLGAGAETRASAALSAVRAAYPNASTANGARIVQWPLSGAVPANKQWAYIPVPGAPYTYYIQARNSGKVLSVNSYVAGAPILQWDNQGAPSQQWREVDLGFTRKYRNVATGLYLDVSGASFKDGATLVQWYETSGANQQFTITLLFQSR